MTFSQTKRLSFFFLFFSFLLFLSSFLSSLFSLSWTKSQGAQAGLELKFTNSVAENGSQLKWQVCALSPAEKVRSLLSSQCHCEPPEKGIPWEATFPPQYTITGRCVGTYQRNRRAVLSWSDLQDVKESMHGVAGGNGEESHDRSPVKRIQDWWTIIKCWANGYQSPRDSFPAGWAHSQFA